MSSRLQQQSKKGFTLVEVLLVLAITGLMLIGVLGSTYSSISSQRYSDSLRSFAEYMRSIYAEVLSPEVIIENEGAPVGNSPSQAILGKVIVFGLDAENKSTVYSATLVGSADITHQSDHGFLSEITDIDNVHTSVFCGDANRPSSVQPYSLLWQSNLAQANDIPTGAHYADPFIGTMIIARTPNSATVHTAFAAGKTYDFAGDCVAANASFRNDLKDQHDGHASFYELNEPTGICVVSENSRIHREVRIAADGRNASAVWLRQGDEENACR